MKISICKFIQRQQRVGFVASLKVIMKILFFFFFLKIKYLIRICFGYKHYHEDKPSFIVSLPFMYSFIHHMFISNTIMDTFVFTINIICQFLDCVRNPEYPQTYGEHANSIRQSGPVIGRLPVRFKELTSQDRNQNCPNLPTRCHDQCCPPLTVTNVVNCVTKRGGRIVHVRLKNTLVASFQRTIRFWISFRTTRFLSFIEGINRQNNLITIKIIYIRDESVHSSWEVW